MSRTWRATTARSPSTEARGIRLPSLKYKESCGYCRAAADRRWLDRRIFGRPHPEWRLGATITIRLHVAGDAELETWAPQPG